LRNQLIADDAKACDVLHWLPVAHRIEYKTAMITFNSIRSTRPSYFNQCDLR